MILENTILLYIGFKGKRYIKYTRAGFTPDKNGYIQITPAQIQQLTPSSPVSFMCECDHCHKQFSLRIRSYIPEDNKILCRQCKVANTNLERYGGITPFVSEKVREKAKQTNLERYGVENALSSPQVQAKAKATMKEKYGVEHITQLESIKHKIANTNLERYGGIAPFASEKIREKAKQTNLERYGVENTFQAEQFKEKIKQTNLKRYGVENVMSSPEIQAKVRKTNLERYGVEHAAQNNIIRERALNTFMKNNTVKTSKFQKKLHNILGGELNHLACRFFLDIALIDSKIDIEYDGGGHDLAIKLKKSSPKQFKNKEIQREYILMRNGWKIIRLISPKDKLFNIYTEQQLVQLVNIATQYLITTTHHWVNIYLEENKYECSQLKTSITDILNM